MPDEPVNPPPTSFVEWSDDARMANLRDTLAASPDPDTLWVFGTPFDRCQPCAPEKPSLS